MSFWTRLTSFFFENCGNDGAHGDDRSDHTETSERVDMRLATLSPCGADSNQGEALLRDLPKDRRIEGLNDIPCEGSVLLQRLTEAAYPPLPRSFPALTVNQTIDLYGAYVHRTAEELPLKTADFNALALPVIRRAICYMHLLPAAKDYHHKGMGGLLAHSFEVGILAARAATDHVFDRSETPRLLYHNRPRWIFAAWLAGFLHDAGKPVTDISVTSGGEVWYPYTESLVDWLQMNNRDGYFVSWKNGRVHNEHRPAVLSILPRIVSTELIDWFRAYGSERIWKSCELAVSGVDGPEDLSLIANLVMRADEESTERDRKSRENLDERKLMVEAQPARRLLTAVKTLITDGTWTVNSPGSRPWVTNLGVFIVWNDVTAEEIWRCAVNELGFRDLPRRAQNMVTLLDAAKCIRPAPEEVSSVQDRYWPVQFAVIPTKAFRCIGLVQADLIFEDGLMPPPSIPAKVVGMNASFEEEFAWKEYVSSLKNAEDAGRNPTENNRKERNDRENVPKTTRRDIPFVRDLGTDEGEPGMAVDFLGDTNDSPSSLSASSNQDGKTARTEFHASVCLDGDHGSDDELNAEDRLSCKDDVPGDPTPVDETEAGAKTETETETGIGTGTETESSEVPVPSEHVHFGRSDVASSDPSGADLSSHPSPKSHQDPDVFLYVPMHGIESGEPVPDNLPGVPGAIDRTGKIVAGNIEYVVTGSHRETKGLTENIVEEASRRFYRAEKSEETLRPELSALLPTDENEALAPSVRNGAVPSTPSPSCADAADAVVATVAAVAADESDKTDKADNEDEADESDKSNIDLLALLYPQNETRSQIPQDQLDQSDQQDQSEPRDLQKPVSNPYPSDLNREGCAQSSSGSDLDLGSDTDSGEEIGINNDTAHDIDQDIVKGINGAGAKLPRVSVEPVHAEQETFDGDSSDADGTVEVDNENPPTLSPMVGMHLTEETATSDLGCNVDAAAGVEIVSLQPPSSFSESSLKSSPKFSRKENPGTFGEDLFDEDNDWTRMYGEDALLDPEENEAAARFFTETMKRAQRREDGYEGADGSGKEEFRNIFRPGNSSPLPLCALPWPVADVVPAGGADATVLEDYNSSCDPFLSVETDAETPTLSADSTGEAKQTSESGLSEELGYADAWLTVPGFDGNKSDRYKCGGSGPVKSKNPDVSDSSKPTLICPGTANVVDAVTCPPLSTRSTRSTRSTDAIREDTKSVQDSPRRSLTRSARDIRLSAAADSLMPSHDASEASEGFNVPVSRTDVAKPKRAVIRGARSADPLEGLLAEIRLNLETRSGPLWSEPVEDSPEGVFISPEKFFERAKELGLTKARIVQAVNSLWQPEDRILGFKVVKSTGKNVRLIGLQKRR